jgi:hypothetical protein
MGRPLNNFALFECLLDEPGTKLMHEMYNKYVKVARDYGHDMQIGSPTWRCSLDHMVNMGYKKHEI